MPITLRSILAEFCRLGKKRRIVCPHCGEKTRFIKYGHYCRYGKGKKKIPVQRYKCQNPKCPKGPRYFSFLPFFLIPFLGISGFFLLRIAFSRPHDSWRTLEKKLSSNLSSLRRWAKLAIRISSWLKKTNCLDEIDLSWNLFTHFYSRAFYPKFHAQ